MALCIFLLRTVRTPPPVTSLQGLCQPLPRPQFCSQLCPGELLSSTIATLVGKPSPHRVPCRSMRELTLERNPLLALFVEEHSRQKAILRYPPCLHPSALIALDPLWCMLLRSSAPDSQGEGFWKGNLLQVASWRERRVPVRVRIRTGRGSPQLAICHHALNNLVSKRSIGLSVVLLSAPNELLYLPTQTAWPCHRVLIKDLHVACVLPVSLNNYASLWRMQLFFITMQSSMVCFSRNNNVTALLMGIMIIDYTTFPTDMWWKSSKYTYVLEQQLSALTVYIFLLTEYFSGDCCQ